MLNVRKRDLLVLAGLVAFSGITRAQSLALDPAHSFPTDFTFTVELGELEAGDYELEFRVTADATSTSWTTLELASTIALRGSPAKSELTSGRSS